MRRLIVVHLVVLLGVLPLLPGRLRAAPLGQAPRCRFFAETGGYWVCDDAHVQYLAAFERWGLQRIGYPVSRHYVRDGFWHQAFQKAIMQARPDQGGAIVLVNIFDDLHRDGFDQRLLVTRQTPLQLPEGWDGPGLTFEQVVRKRQALLNARPALRTAYFSIGDPLTFFGLPTSEVQDMGNHYAIRLQRAVLQEWKETVPWARSGEVTIANGGDIAKELGGLPAAAIVPENAGNAPLPTPTPDTLPTGIHSLIGYYTRVERTAWDQTRVCDDFVVTGGSREMIEELVELVEEGNSVHSLNELGQPVINLNLDSLASADVARIKSSTPEQQVELLVIWPDVPGTEAPVCYSFIEIQAVR